jgi:hypothetical protein
MKTSIAAYRSDDKMPQMSSNLMLVEVGEGGVLICSRVGARIACPAVIRFLLTSPRGA